MAAFKTTNFIPHGEWPLYLFNFLAEEFTFQGLGIGLYIPVHKATANFWNCRLHWESTCRLPAENSAFIPSPSPSALSALPDWFGEVLISLSFLVLLGTQAPAMSGVCSCAG